MRHRLPKSWPRMQKSDLHSATQNYLHPIKSYSSINFSPDCSYTYFRGYLEHFKEMGTTQKVFDENFPSTYFMLSRPCYTSSGVIGTFLGLFGPNSLNHGQGSTGINRKSSASYIPFNEVLLKCKSQLRV